MERFEDLIAWQKALELTSAIYRVTRNGALARDFGLSGQMQRASVSIMANIAEGFERHRPGEFHQYLSTAKASCGELRSHLYVALDADYIDKPAFIELSDSALEVGRILGGLRASIERRNPQKQATQHSGLSTQH
jgi:four helix bundle protein